MSAFEGLIALIAASPGPREIAAFRPSSAARAREASLVTAEKQGVLTAISRRENVHRMADANKAFAHFAW